MSCSRSGVEYGSAYRSLWRRGSRLFTIRPCSLGGVGGTRSQSGHFVLCFFIVERYGYVRMPPTKRTWYDFMIRAGMVALLVGAVLTLSFRIGPVGSGILAVFPVIYTSIMVILHCRVGGPATAAVLANAIPGLAGFGMALLTLHLTAVPLGSASALLIALFVSVAWNAVLYCSSATDSMLKLSI